MKRSTLAKIIGGVVIGGTLLFGRAKEAISLEDAVNNYLINGQGIVSGQVIKTSDEEAVKKNINLEFHECLDNGKIGVFLGSCNIDNNGEYNLEIDSSSNLIRVSGDNDNYYRFRRYINLEDNNFNFDIVPVFNAEVVDKDNNRSYIDFMELFDMWCRSISGATQRWAEQPKVYIKTDLADSTRINLVKEIMLNDWVKFTQRVGKNSFIDTTFYKNGEYMKEGTDPPDYGESRWVRVGWRDKGGPGSHGEYMDGNRIDAGVVFFNLTGPKRETYLQELTQVLGARGETETRYFWDLETGEYLPDGYKIGKLLFSRPIGSISPDIDPNPKIEIIRYIRPPLNLVVDDVQNDHGHKLKLNWEASPSEEKNLVDWYKIFRSRNKNGIENIRHMNDFKNLNENIYACIDSLNNWEQNCAVLIDSVLVGNTEYTDRGVPLNNESHYYWLQAVKDNWGSPKIAGNWQGLPLHVEEEESKKFNISNAYPNPFNLSTKVDYKIPRDCNVEITIYDVLGRKIRTLENDTKNPGNYSAQWDGRDENNVIVGNGVYIYDLKVGDYKKNKKVLLMK